MLFLSVLFAGMLDLKYRKIPDEAVFLICISGVLFNEISAIEMIAGFILPALPLFLIALKNPQIKGGDIKYLAGLGFGVGINALVVILFFALIISCIYKIFMKKNSVPLAFVCLIGFILWRWLF